MPATTSLRPPHATDAARPRRKRLMTVEPSGAAAPDAQGRAAASDRPTFFGIGAQKAGTTWLYQVLSAYPDCSPLPVKEMHFFDAKYIRGPNPYKSVTADFERLVLISSRLSQLVSDRIDHLKDERRLYQDGFLDGINLAARIDKLTKLAARLSVHDTPSYVAYMENWRARAPETLTGEITPAYSLLPAAAFQEILSLYPQARFIFIMRDPIERFWSQTRFFLTMRNRKTNPNDMVGRLLNRDDFTARSDYKRTIENLEAVVPAEQIHYAFFEDLTATETIQGELRRLERFLGLSTLPARAALDFVNKPANVSPKNEMNAENRRLLREALDPVYAFVAQKFGQVPASWAIG